MSRYRAVRSGSRIASRTLSRRRVGAARALSALLVLVFGVSLVPGTAAHAADPAVVSLTVTITDPETGAVVTNVNAETMTNYTVNFAYSCSVANCENVKVVVDPTELDPFYGTHRKETIATFTPPFSPAPAFTGNLAGGYSINLGSVTAGTGGTFAINYRINQRSAGPEPGSFFLNGSQITPRATISATNSNNPAVGTATASWVSSIPEAPTLSLASDGRARTDLPALITVGGDSRCLSFNSAGVLQGIPWMTCAESYSTTVTLPAKAVYTPGSGGVYDEASHTVTFSGSGEAAAGGIYYNDKSFEVVFPSTEYPTDGPECRVNEPFSAVQTVTYLDGTVRDSNPATATRNVEVQNCIPFPKGRMYKAVTGADGGTSNDPILNIPQAPGQVKNSYWQVIAANQANITGFATIVDNDLDQPDIPVRSMSIPQGGPATVTYTLDNGVTDTITLANGATWTAPAGRHIVASTSVSSPLIGPNSVISGTSETRFAVRFHFSVTDTATPGPRTNTATSTITYSENPELGNEGVFDLEPISRTVTLRDFSDITLVAGAPTATAQGGGTPIVDGDVEWRMRGSIQNVSPTSDFRPQYVFLAPKDWNITPGTASVSGDATGVTYDYRTVTYEGETFDAVVATWPTAVTDSGNFSLPILTVTTVPTIAAPAGTNNQTGRLFVGDASGGDIATLQPSAYADVTDFDGDGNITEQYALRTGATSLAPSRSLGVVKEICRPDAESADGCDWDSDTTSPVRVSPAATSIKYRVTLSNTGNEVLTNVAAYDVLPYVGDTGTTNATASTLRGSTVQELLTSVSDVSPGLNLSYSGSTNPARPEVFTGSTDPDDWNGTVADASAIRATMSSLAAASSVSFTYEAQLVGGMANDIACNSVAVIATTLAALEPPAVCAETTPSSLAWEKVSAGDHQERLGGSEWEFTPVDTDHNPTGAPVTVTDCVEDTAVECVGSDADPSAGGFLIEELEIGWYRLIEQRAPAGYILDDVPRFIFVDGDTVLDDPIENTQSLVPSIPLTGGIGILVWTTGGLILVAFMLLALGVQYWTGRRRRPVTLGSAESRSAEVPPEAPVS